MSTVEQVKPAPVRTDNGGIAAWWSNSRTFLTEVRNEMARVTWPSRREVWATTLVVILTSIFFGVYLYGVDLVVSKIMGAIFKSFGAA